MSLPPSEGNRLWIFLAVCSNVVGTQVHKTTLDCQKLRHWLYSTWKLKTVGLLCSVCGIMICLATSRRCRSISGRCTELLYIRHSICRLHSTNAAFTAFLLSEVDCIVEWCDDVTDVLWWRFYCFLYSTALVSCHVLLIFLVLTSWQ